jgi:general secretion pathway protein A
MHSIASALEQKSFTNMYEQFYNVRTNPFALTPDPEYLFLSDEQREAIASLMYAVLARRGFSVLIGDAGTGKTTLLRALMRSIPENRAVFSVVVNPTLSPAEFLRTCVADFGIDTGECAKDILLTKLHRFLVEVHKNKKVAVLVVDEAQRLSPELLEEVRLLTNFETDKEKLIQVILAGQNELADILDRYDLRQLKQRVSTRLHIRPLSADAIASYIRYRWSRCSSTPPPFDGEAMAVIQDVSAGIPRLINSICENSLILGFAQGQRTIDATIIGAVAADLHLTYSRRRPDTVSDNSQDVPAVSERNQRVAETAPLPEPVSAQQTSVQHTAMPTLDRYAPKRGWRVLFGLD